MRKIRGWTVASCLLAGLAGVSAPVVAQSPLSGARLPGFHDEEEKEGKGKKIGWSTSTDLSLVYTEGNSNTQSFGLKNTTTRDWQSGRFRLKLDSLRTNTDDDRFLQVESGLTWDVGADPPETSELTLVIPPVEPDVDRFFVEARYDRKFGKTRTWNAGGSWDRNADAGILSRSIVFGGLGHVWVDGERLHFNTSYGLSFTDREEATPDPEKDPTFLGIRLTWDFYANLGKVTRYDNDMTSNVSLADRSDFSFDMTNSLRVSMSKKLSLKISLQWLYNNEPALEDVDVVALIDVVDPDGIPSSGDEFFITVDSGGASVTLGESQARKDQLDTTFRTSLVITF